MTVHIKRNSVCISSENNLPLTILNALSGVCQLTSGNCSKHTYRQTSGSDGSFVFQYSQAIETVFYCSFVCCRNFLGAIGEHIKARRLSIIIFDWLLSMRRLNNPLISCGTFTLAKSIKKSVTRNRIQMTPVILGHHLFNPIWTGLFPNL